MGVGILCALYQQALKLIFLLFQDAYQTRECFLKFLSKKYFIGGNALIRHLVNLFVFISRGGVKKTDFRGKYQNY